MSASETSPKIQFEPGARQRGTRMCKASVKQMFGQYTWIFGNLPGDRQNALYALLNHVVKALDYLDLESSNGLSLDVWSEFRDDLSNAFLDQYASVDLVALVDACRRYHIPRQFLFELLDGVDAWIRDRGFDTYDELLVFASRFGGAAMVAAVPIVGFVKPGFEIPAIQAGQAILLTQLLAKISLDIKLNKIFFAREDIEETGLSIARVKVRQPSDGLKHLVRLYGSRIEKLMQQGGQLIEYLDYDARRSFTSLMAVHFDMLMQMRLQPETVFSPEGLPSRREMFRHRTKHVLGLEGKVPVIPEEKGHH